MIICKLQRKLSLLVLIVLLSCCGTKIRNLEKSTDSVSLNKIKPILNDTIAEWIFDMSIQYKDNYNSGLLAVGFEQQGTYRLVFMNKAGPKLLDVSVSPQNLIVNNIIKQLDKKMLVNVLEKDFRMLFDKMNRQNASSYKDLLLQCQVVKFKSGKTYYDYINDNNLVYKRLRAKGKRSIVEMNIEYNEDQMPKIINIQHLRIPLKIKLSRFTSLTLN